MMRRTSNVGPDMSSQSVARMFPLVAAAALGGTSVWLVAAPQQQGGAVNQIAIDEDDIAGVVTSGRGPEAASG